MAQQSETKEDVANALIRMRYSKKQDEDEDESARLNDEDYADRAVTTYRKIRGDPEGPQEVVDYADHFQRKPRKSLVQKRLHLPLSPLTDALHAEDVPKGSTQLSAKSSNSSHRKMSLHSPRPSGHSMNATMTDGELMEEIWDVLTEVDYDLEQPDAREYLYEQLNAMGKNNETYRKRIDYVAEEITRQRYGKGREKAQLVQCGADCVKLKIALESCANVAAIKPIDADIVDHCLTEHWDHRLMCQYGDCQWRQKALISRGGSNEVHLHGHFYHGVTLQPEITEMTHGELMEEIQDVLTEVDYDLEQEHAKGYLYDQLGAVGKYNAGYRKRIDLAVQEISNQRVESFVECPLYQFMFLDYVQCQRKSDVGNTPSPETGNPSKETTKMSQLEVEEYQRIQNQFEKEMKGLIGDNTKEDVALQAANYWCKYEECPCIERIDILMKTYHKFLNSEFWLKVPITPLVTLGDLYQHQQLYDDFIHVKLYHVDRHLNEEMERQDTARSFSAETKEEEEETDEMERRKDEYEMKMKEKYEKAKQHEPHNVGFKLHQRFSIDEDDAENADEKQTEYEHANVGYLLYQRFSRYPCPEISNCKGHARHHRIRGSGNDDHGLFHIINDQSMGAKSIQIINDKDRTLQEECDKIHSYFYHSTVQFPTNPDELRREERMGNKRRALDGIAGASQGRSYSRRARQSRGRGMDSKASKPKQDDEQKESDKQDDNKPNTYLGKKEDEEWIQSIRNLPENKRYEALVGKMGIFRWQSAHGFRAGQERGLSHLKPKYIRVKDEVLNNSFATISIHDWNTTMRKAKIFKASFAYKRMYTLYDGNYHDQVTEREDEWKKGTVALLQEIVTLKLYTDFDEMQHELKKCLRWETISTIIHGTEDDGQDERRAELIQRLEEFFHWRSELLLVLNKFGRKFRHQNKRWQLYHGVNAKMILNPVQTMAFSGPLSATTSPHVAKIFATAKGMVLELTSQFPRLNLCHAFDVSAISDFPELCRALQCVTSGFVYLRVLYVFTRPLVNNIGKAEEWTQQPIASQIRSAFFVIHLFREQVFSMSAHLEFYLMQFLKCFKKECCRHGYAEKEKLQKEGRGDEIKNIERRALMRDEIKFSFLSWLCTYIAGHPYPLTKKSLWEKGYNKRKNRFQHDNWKLVMKVLWNKFEEYRQNPNSKQVIKIDRISENLKRFFLTPDLNNHGNQKKKLGKKQGKWCVDFEKILAIFPNCREIHYFNQYRFDKEALEKLVKTLEARKGDDSIPFWRLRFLYYDYSDSKEAKTKDGLGIPEDGDNFYNPDKLMEEEKKLMDRLKVLGWCIQWDVCQTQENGEKWSYGCRIKISRKRKQDFNKFKKQTFESFKRERLSMKSKMYQINKRPKDDSSDDDANVVAEETTRQRESITIDAFKKKEIKQEAKDHDDDGQQAFILNVTGQTGIVPQQSETEEDVANQLIQFGDSQGKVAEAQRKVTNSRDINQVLEQMVSSADEDGNENEHLHDEESHEDAVTTNPDKEFEAEFQQSADPKLINLMQFVDDSILADDTSNCEKANDEESIIKKCSHLKRLVVALKIFEFVKEDNAKFDRLLIQNYGVQFLDDVDHYYSVHQDDTERIKEEMIKEQGFAECDVEQCTVTSRHFRNIHRRNESESTSQADTVDDNIHPKIKFYRGEYDSFHLNLFHLYEMGYRIRSQPTLSCEDTETKQDDEMKHISALSISSLQFAGSLGLEPMSCGDTEAYGRVDPVIAETISSLRDLRQRFDKRVGRTRENEKNNKYNIGTGDDSMICSYRFISFFFDSILNTLSDDKYTEYTFTDCCLLFMSDNRMDEQQLQSFHQWFYSENYDTEALKDDLSEFKCSDDGTSTSNIYEMTTADLVKTMKTYVKLAPDNGGNLREMGERNRPPSTVHSYFGYELEELYIGSPKYANLKEEVIESGFLSMEKFHEFVVLKAKEHAKKRSTKAMKAAFKDKDNCHYGIEQNSPITELHIQSVILYTCFTHFCTAFSETFRRKYLGEPLKAVRERNKEYWWTSKLLRETVELFGTKVMDQREVSYFCGMNRELAIPQYMIYLCGPTSTSSKKEVALGFGGEEGILLTLSYQGYLAHGDNRLRFFNCKTLSNYKEEDECLFFGGAWRIRIISVLVIQMAKDYVNFSRVMFLLDAMIGGIHVKPKNVCVKPQDAVFLEHLFDVKIGDGEPDHVKYGKYIYDCFEAYTQKKKSITVFTRLLRNKYLPSYLRKLILYNLTTEIKKNNDNILRPRLLEIFPNLRIISIFPVYHPFSLKRFCAIYSQKKLLQHGKIERLQITVRGQSDFKWLRSQYEDEIKGKVEAEYSKFHMEFIPSEKEDKWVIRKNMQFRSIRSVPLGQ